MPLRRARGALLRIARRRPWALASGAALAAPALWFEIAGGSSRWWLDGLSLIAGATGIALLWAGLTGARPDWVDEEVGTKN